MQYEVQSKLIEGFVDADWGGDTLDRKIVYRICILCRNYPVSLKSKKQSCVALSSTKAKYVTLSDAAKETIFGEIC